VLCPQHRVGGSSGSSLLEGLLPVLECSILPTHRCKYVQFVLYFLCTHSTTASQVCVAYTTDHSSLALESKPLTQSSRRFLINTPRAA
jgi:hypothetical protein